jgi:hypothetical protein
MVSCQFVLSIVGLPSGALSGALGFLGELQGRNHVTNRGVTHPTAGCMSPVPLECLSLGSTSVAVLIGVLKLRLFAKSEGSMRFLFRHSIGGVPAMNMLPLALPAVRVLSQGCIAG